MGASIGADAKKAHEAWSSAERASYVASSGIVCPQGEEAVQRFLADAIVVAPLPAPWVMHRSQRGEYFFVNRRTGVASWSHPLEPCLRELADVCRKCLDLEADLRDATICGLHSKWEADAKGEYLKWFSVDDVNGQTYYCHRESGEAMWEHPAEALLPEHYMRLTSIEMLRSDGYIARIKSRPSIDIAHPFSTVSRRLRRRRVQESPRCRVAQAYFIGDPEGDSDAEHSSHLSIDIPSDDDSSSTSGASAACVKDSDLLSSCSTRAEAYFIGDSDEDPSDLDDPWDLDLEADGCNVH